VVLNSGLFHFTADINGRPAAVTIDNCSLPNLVSIEVVEKMHLHTYKKLNHICWLLTIMIYRLHEPPMLLSPFMAIQFIFVVMWFLER
jgi:hypothetical protein